MKMPEYQVLPIICDCHDLMHQVRFEYDDVDPYSVSMTVMMNQERTWLKRIIPAIRFVLNLRGQHDWHYTDVMMQDNMVAELQKYLEQFQADRSAYWDHREGKAAAYVPIRGYTQPGHRKE